MLEVPPVPDANPEEVTKGYPWPASRLTKGNMIRLTELRERLGNPITKLLHDAVRAYYQLIVKETAITEKQTCASYAKLTDAAD